MQVKLLELTFTVLYPGEEFCLEALGSQLKLKKGQFVTLASIQSLSPPLVHATEIQSLIQICTVQITLLQERWQGYYRLTIQSLVRSKNRSMLC